MNRIKAIYEIQSPKGIEHAAEVIAGEQSTGTFVRLKSETDELRQQFAARVEKVETTANADAPALPCKIQGEYYQSGRVTLSWPVSNFGVSLPNLLATVAGNLFELSELSAIRLIDVRFPDEFIAQCPGPQFGASGTRSLATVGSDPIIGTIIKPSVGLTPAATAELVEQLLGADIDFIKDDELQANGPLCPFSERVDAVTQVLRKHQDKSGKQVMYAFNITDEIDTMRRNLDYLEAKGGTCAMVSLFSIGITGLHDVRKHCPLAIHGHRNGWGLMSRSPDIGIAFNVWQKLWRLAGADHLHVNGLANKFSEPDDVVAESAQAVQTPLGKSAETQFLAMPVYSSAQTIWQIAPASELLGNHDFIFCAGGGIMSHPGGPAAGVRSLRQAVEVAKSAGTLESGAQQYAELRQAMEHFKRPTFGG